MQVSQCTGSLELPASALTLSSDLKLTRILQQRQRAYLCPCSEPLPACEQADRRMVHLSGASFLLTRLCGSHARKTAQDHTCGAAFGAAGPAQPCGLPESKLDIDPDAMPSVWLLAGHAAEGALCACVGPGAYSCGGGGGGGARCAAGCAASACFCPASRAARAGSTQQHMTQPAMHAMMPAIMRMSTTMPIATAHVTTA